MTQTNGNTAPGAVRSTLSNATKQMERIVKPIRSGEFASALGWLSLGLGTLELTAPKATAAAIGAHGGRTGRTVLRAMGARELAAGVGIFSTQPRPNAWVRARVAGDLLDLGLLGMGLATRRKGRVRHAIALATVTGVTVLDALEVRRLTRHAGEPVTPGIHASAAVTINKSPEDVYRAWRDLESLPGFMDHLESVSVTGARDSHWVAHAPGGRLVEWDAEIVRDEPGKELAWRSKPRSAVRTEGVVRFQPAPGGGAELRVELSYQPFGGSYGAVVAWLLGEEPTQQLHDDLARFKQVAETGEVVRSEASPHGARVMDLFRQRPARPFEHAS